LSQLGAVIEIHRHSLLTLACVVAALTAVDVFAQEASDEPDHTATDTILTTEEAAIEADTDGSLDDAEGSISLRKIVRGFNLSADIRGAYAGSELDSSDGESISEDVLQSRARLRADMGLLPFMRATARLAARCSDFDCNMDFVLEDSIPTTNGMADGDVTVDEFFLHWYRLGRLDVALGRMQTKFVARGGVFAKSLDRNDSHNMNVNWTDGVHATFKAKRGWVSHLILQRNAREGATNVRRGPLDFDDGDARITYFASFENLERTPYFLQRALDISYLPKSLLKYGDSLGRRVDYTAIVLRSANRWPERDDGPRLRVAAELGYAPETQTEAAAGLAGSGDTDGLAWSASVSLMEFRPHHSIGINYAETGAGWLLSPQYRPNESLVELRYQWRRSRKLAFDVRIRRRKELQQLALSNQKREELDFFLRFTWGGTIL
jgi:hypothetical protein